MDDLYWRGKLVDDMSREELIEAVKYAARELHSHYTPEAIRAQALGSVEMLKRGERRFT